MKYCSCILLLLLRGQAKSLIKIILNMATPLNTNRLLIMSIGFLLLFCSFNTAQSLAAQVLENLGLGNLGFYSLAVLYCFFGLSAFIATSIVDKCGGRLSMFLGALCYTVYIGAFMGAEISYDPDTKTSSIDKRYLTAIILIAASINGFGAAILWVAQGKYISQCANTDNKGMFNGVFWAFFMSSMVFGNLIGAFVLGTLSELSFYVICLVLCFVAAFSFLLLSPPVTYMERPDNSLEEIQEPKSVARGIKQTWQCLISKRMLILTPLITQTAFNIAIQSSVFVTLMEKTMEDKDWDKDKRNQFALLAMIGLGAGEILGAIVFGRIGDRLSMRVLIAANMFSAVMAFSVTMWYVTRFRFSLGFAFAMTFVWGFSDGGLNTLVNCILGFQFDSKTVPFSVKQVVQSLMIFAITSFESILGSQNSYLFYLMVEMTFCIVSWLLFNFSFEIREEITYETVSTKGSKIEAGTART